MSDNIPFEIQREIIQRIPDTKSVIRCRSVSKAWKSVIDSKKFVKAHTLRHSHHQAHRHLLIRKRDSGNKQVKYVSVVDDDTFPHQKLNVFVPNSIEKLSNDLHINQIIGASHGLFCLYDKRIEDRDTAVIWNPSIRKTVVIPVPNVFMFTVFGFGVCPRNLDPKLVKIIYYTEDVDASTQVEVFTLSSGGTWRSPLSGNLPHKMIGFRDSQAVVDGFIYWDAIDGSDVDDGIRELIMSFDLTSEEFTKVNLPDCLALNPNPCISLSNLRDSLAVLDLHNMFTERGICDVWMMIGHGCTRSFNKLYSIDASIGTTVGFRKSGAPIIEVENDNEDYHHHELAIYEPESKTITNLGIHGFYYKFFVHSYKETLLLLDH